MHVAQQTCPLEIRDIVWAALERLAVCMTTYPEIYPKAIALFIQLLNDLYTKTRLFIVPNNIRRLVRMTYPLGLYLDPNPPPSTMSAGQPQPMQSAILNLLRSMVCKLKANFLLHHRLILCYFFSHLFRMQYTHLYLRNSSGLWRMP